MLASSNTTTNENRRADADTWIPAFAGMTGGAWGEGGQSARRHFSSPALRTTPPADGRGIFEAIPHVGLSAHTTTDENRRADADTWIPAFAGMTGGAAHYLCVAPIFEAIPLLASSNTTTNENRRVDADTWIPAFAGLTGRIPPALGMWPSGHSGFPPARQ